MAMRQRVGVIILDKAHILLLYRRKQGSVYYVIPGGGVEPGESLEEAAIREIWEETGLEIRLGHKLWTHLWGEQHEHYFLATACSGKLGLNGPEREQQSADNIYRPVWLPLDRLRELPLVPETMKAVLIATFKCPQVYHYLPFSEPETS